MTKLEDKKKKFKKRKKQEVHEKWENKSQHKTLQRNVRSASMQKQTNLQENTSKRLKETQNQVWVCLKETAIHNWLLV